MRRYSYLILSFFISCTLACNSTHIQTKKSAINSIPNLNLQLKGSSKIVFLTFEIALTDSIKNTYSFSLINKNIVDGSLKKNLFKEELTVERNYLYIRFSNSFGEESNWIKVDDPLNRLYEFPGNAENDLNKTVIQKNKGILSFRFQSDSSYNIISIYKPNTNLQLNKIYHATL